MVVAGVHGNADYVEELIRTRLNEKKWTSEEFRKTHELFKIAEAEEKKKILDEQEKKKKVRELSKSAASANCTWSLQNGGKKSDGTTSTASPTEEANWEERRQFYDSCERASCFERNNRRDEAWEWSFRRR